MLFSTKILCSLLCTISFICPLFSMDDLDGGLDSGIETRHKSRSSERPPSIQREHPSDLPSGLNRQAPRTLSAHKSFHAPRDTVEHAPKRTLALDDLDSLESKQPQVSDESTSNDSFDSVVYGNQDIEYSNWLLERYAKKTASCWSFIYSIFGDLDSISHAAETALTVCTQYVEGDIAVYVIEVTMIADTLHQLYSLSQKIAPIRAKQARMYEAQNKANALKALDPERPLTIDGKEISEDSEYYVSKSAACCYNFCATYRNIAWEQMGILAILCRVAGNSIVAFSLNSDSNTYLFVATLLRIAGTFSLIYAKSLSKNTKDMEEKAMDSAAFIEYRKRQKMAEKAAAAAAKSAPVADMV